MFKFHRKTPAERLENVLLKMLERDFKSAHPRLQVTSVQTSTGYVNGLTYCDINITGIRDTNVLG